MRGNDSIWTHRGKVPYWWLASLIWGGGGGRGRGQMTFKLGAMGDTVMGDTIRRGV